MCDRAPESLTSIITERVRSRPGVPAGLILEGMEGPRPCSEHFCKAVHTLLKSGTIGLGAGGSGEALTSETVLEAELIERKEEASGCRILGDRFRVDLSSPIGRGSGGTVYRGVQLALDRTVAVKILGKAASGIFADDDIMWERFRREPRLIATVQHPHIVHVIDSGEEADDLWYAMEYLEGGTLETRIAQEGPLAPATVLEYMLALVQALDAVLAQGILHRDVKPGNIFNAGIKLADFGMARRESPRNGESELTPAGTLIGTLPYMAPERTQGEKGGPRSDMYSLGATFYEAATGRMLFNGLQNRSQWIRHHVEVAPCPITQRMPEFPRPLASIIHRCLEKRPSNRFASYAELIHELRSAAASVPTAARSRPASGEPWTVRAFLADPEAAIRSLEGRYEGAYGTACLSTRSSFLQALWGLGEKEGIGPTCAALAGLSAVEFPARLRGVLDPMREGRASSEPVSPEPLEYLRKAVRAMEDDASDGAPPDPGPVEVLLQFLENALDHATLAEFRTRRGEPPPGPLPPGARFGAYRILAQVGRGGMADVYKAVDTQRDRTVALKVLHSGSAKDLERFEREARIAGRLRHPSIAVLHEIGRIEQGMFIAMEFIDGVPLDAEKRTIPRNVELMRDAARVMAYAHGEHVLHLDLKPANLMVDREGRIHLIDFGISREFSRIASGGLSLTRTVRGTPQFMSPEQARGDLSCLDARSDQYGLGATLYALVAGRPPFDNPNLGVLLVEVMSRRPPPASRYNPQVPVALDRVIERSMAIQPEDRYPTTEAFADALDLVLRENR